MAAHAQNPGIGCGRTEVRRSRATRRGRRRPLDLPGRGARTLLAVLVAGLAATAAHAQEAPAPAASERPEPGSELRVWLLTAGPGDAVWERYGHNAIRLLDTSTGRDVSYNWGIFDFEQVDFIPRFLQGRMLYSMAVFPTGPLVDAYARTGREIVLQELALSPAQKLELLTFAETNALPENRDYVYQYFLDNCSTRVRDVLDLVLDGLLSSTFGAQPTGTTYRFHTRRLAQADPLIGAGMDVLLGSPTDAPISVWEEMFIPMTLRDAVRAVEVEADDGTARPLVVDEQVVAASERPGPPGAPASRITLYALLGVLLGGVIVAPALSPTLGSRGLRGLALGVGVAWSLLAGALGTILVLLLFTDHTFAHWNENLFLFTPLSLALAPATVLSAIRDAWRARAAILATAVLAVAFVGLGVHLLPGTVQRNGELFAAALPMHLALWWLLRGRRAEPVTTAATRA